MTMVFGAPNTPRRTVTLSKNDTPKRPPDDISAFGDKIKKARKAEESRQLWKRGFDKAPQSPLGLAFRVSVELVSALVVGLAIGYALDQWLDTGPFLMVAFLFMGFAAGLMNVYRMATGMSGSLGYKNKIEVSKTDNVNETPKEGKD